MLHRFKHFDQLCKNIFSSIINGNIVEWGKQNFVQLPEIMFWF